MGASKQPRKVLRIGVVREGRLIEERLLKPGQPVTVGSSPKNTFTMSSAALPRRFPLLSPRGDSYLLSFLEGMEGSIALDESGLTSLASLRPRATLQKDGSWQLELPVQVRGKLLFGGTTLLFQLVAPPPVPAAGERPRLASRLRNIDPVYWRFVMLSFLVHVGLIVHAMAQPVPPAPTIEEYTSSRIRVWIPVKKPDPPKDDPVEATPKPKVKVASVPRPSRVDKPEPEPEPSPIDARDKRRADLEKKTILAWLTTHRQGGGPFQVENDGRGSVNPEDWKNLLKGGAPTTGTGNTITIRSGANTNGVPEVGPMAPITTQPMEIKVAQAPRKIPPPVPMPSTITGGDRDREKTESMLKSRMGSVQACYERALNLNPTLHGKFYLEFTIEPSGRTSSAQIRAAFGGVDEVLESCLKIAIGRMYFGQAESTTDISLPVVFTEIK